MLAGFNDLATLLPDIAAEWSDRNYPLLPTQVTVFANRKAWWKCKDCGREWNTLISTRSGGSKCPYCSGYIFLKGFNDLQTTHPEIASEWSEKNLPLKPDEVNVKSRKNVWWRCSKCGNEWKSVINARVKGTVCPVCAEREVLAGYNDLATTDSQLLSEWDYEQNKLKPTEVSRTSAKRAWWKCRHGHSWSMKINERTILKKGYSFLEAVETIIGHTAIQAPVYEKPQPKEENKPLLLPEKCASNRVITEYLFGRGIVTILLFICRMTMMCRSS